MRRIVIQDKLEELSYPVSELSLGEFDFIGEYCAKKNRNPDHPLFKTAGCFFRPNYERGMLIYALIKAFKIESFLEIGFGRGHATMCAALAMETAGIKGKVVTVDPNFDEKHLQVLQKIFPKQWFDKVSFYKGTSDDYFANNDEKFELIYIDGDHRHDAVQRDWGNSFERCTKYVLFDDYYLPTKVEKDIEVSSVVDSIVGLEKELVITDRRIFHDDRGLSDDEIDYGQVLIKHPSFDTSEFLMDW